jgi:hypothetical protein
MLESNVSVGDTCKEIGARRHGSDDADKVQRHNAEDLSVNRNFELSPRQIVCRRLNPGQGTVRVRRSTSTAVGALGENSPILRALAPGRL